MADVGGTISRASNVDGTILKHADSMSPEEISLILGGIVSPQAVAARTQSLLKAKDWLTEAQEDQLVTLRLKQMFVELTESRQSGDYKYLTIKLDVLKALGDRIDKRKAATDVDLNTLYGNQGQIMMKAFDLALAHMRGAFSGQIDIEAWDAEVAEALLYARGEIAKHEAIEA